MIKSNRIFILFVIITFIFAFLEGGNLPYIVFYAFLLIFLLGIAVVMANSKNLEVTIVSNKDAYFSGENDDFSVVVTNNGVIPMCCLVVKNIALAELNNKYKGDAVRLGYDGDKWIKNNIKFERRGLYDLGNVYVEFNDLFFIFKKSQNVKYNKTIKVYPKVYNIKKLDSKGMDIFKTSVSRKSGIEDIYSSLDVRKYREGDNLKKIHWRVSAKYGELFVRNFDVVSGEESNIFLDMSYNNFEYDQTGIIEEKMVDFCVSLISYMLHKGIESKVHINCEAASEFTVDTKEQLNDLIEFFVTEKSDCKEKFVNFINANLNKIPKLSWIGIITSTVTNRLRDTLIGMKDYGYSITVYYAVETEEQQYNVGLLNKIGIETYNCCDILNNTGE